MQAMVFQETGLDWSAYRSQIDDTLEVYLSLSLSI
jgi:hypothetical protein